MANFIMQRTLNRNIFQFINRRLVSTSRKNNETVAADAIKTGLKSEKKTEKNWISYGFLQSSKADDRNAMHSAFFASVTLVLVVGGYYYMYLPDLNLRDWAIREAFLELRRREQNGLPLVDPNLIDPSKINLPSDEELGDTEIII